MKGPVLIIGDDVTLRKLLREWLQTVFDGLEVTVAASTSAAAVVGSCQPVAVLVDVDAVVAKGASVVRAMKATAPMAEIVALTYDDHEALRADMTAAGAGACLSKTHLRRLLPMIREWLARDHEGSTLRDELECVVNGP